jgi:aminopeptidase N
MHKTKIATAAALATLLAACATSQPPLTEYTANSGSERSSAQLAMEFEKADLKLRIDPATRSIDGDALLTFGTRAPLRQVDLDLDRNLPIDAIAVDGQSVPATGWRNPEGRLSIDLPRTFEPGTRLTVRVRYHGKPHVAKKAPWDGGFVWSTTPDGQPWVASAVEGEGCDIFWPCIDHPMGKPKEVDEHFTVPAPLVAAGNGTAMGMTTDADGWHTWHWHAKSPSTYGISVNVGPYKELDGEYRSRYGNVIPLRLWYLPQNEANAKELFGEFPAMIDYLESAIGPYPFGDEKIGVVETPHKGMEHQTVNAYGNKYAKTVYGFDDLMQHEFAHEWFGNQLTNANWDDMWLHESLASYLQPLFSQYLHGDMPYYAWLMQFRGGVRNKAPIVSGKPKREEDVYDTDKGGPGQDIYVKGALVMHTLRGLVGDAAFFAIVRESVYGRPDPKPGNFTPRYGTTPEFMAIARRVAGRDLDWFFQAYLYQAALPDLQAKLDGGTLRLSWKTEKDTPFPMPVDVRVGERVVTVPMADGRGSVAIPAGATWTLDPHSKVLRREAHIERFQQYQDAQKKAKAAK